LEWIDGECYQFASTGPCEDHQWFVLDSIVDGKPVAKCQDRRCEEGSVWSSNSCSCASLQLEDQNATVKTGIESHCKEGEQLVVSPYGVGVCAVNNNLNNRIFELLKDGTTSINCYVDENGKCRKSIQLRGRMDNEDEDFAEEDPFTSLIQWLEQFEKPSEEECFNGSADQKNLGAIEVIEVPASNESLTLLEEGL